MERAFPSFPVVMDAVVVKSASQDNASMISSDKQESITEIVSPEGHRFHLSKQPEQKEWNLPLNPKQYNIKRKNEDGERISMLSCSVKIGMLRYFLDR